MWYSRKMRLILIAILTMVATVCMSQTWVSIPFASKHLNGTYNERNPGIGIEHKLGNINLYAITYDNSFNRQTTSFGVIYRALSIGNIKADLLIGPAQGYWNRGEWRMIAAPRLSYELKKIAFDVYVFPPIDGGRVSVGALGFAARFKF